jgi:hypothetical protein
MTPFHLILTHPGSAHKDEFLACSVLLAVHRVAIERREPTIEDIASPSICVVDVGHQHDPALNNFDHHQFARDSPPTCSLSLVLMALELYEDARQLCDWLEPAEWFDCRGPIDTAKWLGVDREILNKLNSPMDMTLLRRFAASARIAPDEPLAEIMCAVGEDLLSYLRTMHARLEFIGHHAQLWDLSLADGPATVLFMPRTDPLPEDPSSGIDQYIVTRSLADRIVATVSPDRRGGGYGLSRFRDDPRLDFSRISTHPAVHFAHARGFVAKTSATGIEELKSLLSLAAGSPPPG